MVPGLPQGQRGGPGDLTGLVEIPVGDQVDHRSQVLVGGEDGARLEGLAGRLLGGVEYLIDLLVVVVEGRGGRGEGQVRAGGGDGDVSLVMMLDLQTEVEMKLPGRFRVSPQIAGAIKAVSGVVDVQTL